MSDQVLPSAHVDARHAHRINASDLSGLSPDGVDSNAPDIVAGDDVAGWALPTAPLPDAVPAEPEASDDAVAPGSAVPSAATPALSVDQANSVTFLSGVTAGGAVAAVSFNAWNRDDPATYNATVSYVSKYGGGAAGTAGGTVGYYLDPGSNWTAAEAASFSDGLALWSAVANITFVQVATSAASKLQFVRAPGSGRFDTSGNISDTIGSTTITATANHVVTMDTNPSYWSQLGSFTYSGGYGVDSVVHEEGHVLGLGHDGAYNGEVDSATQQYDATDTRQWSIMSYIEPSDTNAKYYSSYTVKNTNWGGEDPTTWMPLDILAAQRLYGVASGGPLSGGQVFGFNTNIAASIRPFFDFTVNSKPVVTLYDTGTGNTLDLSGFAQAATVDLKPGTFSSADGLTNNIGIAFNTAIDKFVGGAGNDEITVNGDGDAIDGGGGVNTVDFSGTANQYRITSNGAGVVTITDLVSGRDGTNTLTNVQYARFSVGAVALYDLRTVTFGEYPVGTFNPNFAYAGNQVDMIGKIVADGNQPNSPALAANSAFTGPIYAGFDHPVVHVEFDAYFSQAGSSVVTVFGQGGTILSSAANSVAGLLHYSFDSASGIGGIEVDNVGAGTSVTSLDTLSFAQTLPLVATSSTLSIYGLHATLAEGNSGTTPFTFLVQRTGDVSAAASVEYGVFGTGTNPAPATAFQNGVLPSGTVSFAAGQSQAVITVPVVGNTIVQPTQTFGVVLFAPSAGVAVGTNRVAIGAILDDDAYHPAKTSDCNGDGTSDMLWQAASGAIIDYTMSAGTITGGTVVGTLPSGYKFLASGDFNGDATADQLWQDPNGNLIDYTMNNAAIVGGAVIGALPTGTKFLAAADFNGDGTSDILVQRADNVLVDYTMRGGAITAATVDGVIDPTLTFLAAGDFNGDGTADELWQNSSGVLVDYTVKNGAIAAGAVIGVAASNYKFLAAADFNGDGTADQLFESTSGLLVDYIMKSGAISTATVLGVVDPTLKFLAAGDYNGDGTADLMMQATTGGLIDYTVKNSAIVAGAVVGGLDSTFKFLA